VKLLYNSFYGTRSVEQMELGRASEFVTYVVANIEGNMLLNGNCFVSNMVTIAPVLSYKGKISSVLNGGSVSSTLLNEETCEFVAIVLNPHESTSTALQSTPLSAETEYTCVNFDVVDACAAPDEADSDTSRGVADNSTVIDNGHLSGSENPTSSTPGPGGVVLYCFMALMVAVLVITMVVVSYNVRRGASPLQLPSFRSDPIPPIL
jgi:hypothetical protein